MDLIDAMYANEMWKRETSHATYIFQMQNGVKNDPYVTENAWKYEVYAWLRNLGKKVQDVSYEDIEWKANSINDAERRSWWLYAWCLILSEFYGLPLRMVADRNSYDGVPEEQFRMLKQRWRVEDAYYKYQIQEQWELTADGKVKTLEPVQDNNINNVDIDANDLELNEWKKIKQRLEKKLEVEVVVEKREELENDLQKADDMIKDLSAKVKI